MLIRQCSRPCNSGKISSNSTGTNILSNALFHHHHSQGRSMACSLFWCSCLASWQLQETNCVPAEEHMQQRCGSMLAAAELFASGTVLKESMSPLGQRFSPRLGTVAAPTSDATVVYNLTSSSSGGNCSNMDTCFLGTNINPPLQPLKAALMWPTDQFITEP